MNRVKLFEEFVNEKTLYYNPDKFTVEVDKMYDGDKEFEKIKYTIITQGKTIVLTAASNKPSFGWQWNKIPTTTILVNNGTINFFNLDPKKLDYKKDKITTIGKKGQVDILINDILNLPDDLKNAISKHFSKNGI